MTIFSVHSPMSRTEVKQPFEQAVSAIIDRVTFADVMRRVNEMRSQNNDLNFSI
jgi:hypothetical protein